MSLVNTMALRDQVPKEHKSFYHKGICTHMFIAALFTIAKTWNQPKCPSMIDWIKKMWAYTTWTTMQPYKGMRSCPLRDMNGAGRHYSQQTNTGTEN